MKIKATNGAVGRPVKKFRKINRLILEVSTSSAWEREMESQLLMLLEHALNQGQGKALYAILEELTNTIKNNRRSNK